MHRDGKSEKELRKRKKEMLKEVYRVLALCLGNPPDTFELVYEAKNKKTSIPRILTPIDFYRNEIGVELSDYVCLYNDPTRDYLKLYQISLDRNMVEKPDVNFVNVGIADLKSYIIKSLLDNEVVWFGADVRKECDRELGVMAVNLLDYETLFDIQLPKTKEERILYHDSVPTHAMVFTGVDLRDGKSHKWCVENSWGKERGKEGFYTLYDSWFDEYVYEAVINRKYLPGNVLALLETEAIKLPEDDAMR
jgi:bleomycin hydrolase